MSSIILTHEFLVSKMNKSLKKRLMKIQLFTSKMTVL